MRFEVPQFIEIEDKIFGPLTWRQFLYLSGGVGFSVVMFFTVPLIVFVIFGLPLAALAGALSFYPVNNRPFSYFLEAIVKYLSSQRLYLWRQQSDIVHRASAPAKPSENGHGLSSTATKTRTAKGNITSLARKLELQALQKSE
ncbi:PrgI family protein [Candidatus Kaiserbacteria bacterium]|nr:PrgI family protein [Candidatus Kaiserbacteria bacterium]